MKKHKHPRESKYGGKYIKSLDAHTASKKSFNVAPQGQRHTNPLVGGGSANTSDTVEPFAGWMGFLPENAVGNPKKIKLWKEYVKKEKSLWQEEMKNERRSKLYGKDWGRAGAKTRTGK